MFMANSNAGRFGDSEIIEGDYLAAANRGAGEHDFCSRSGAQELKDKIEAYWAERGQTVRVLLHNVGFHPAIRAARFDVRSDMINGMPRPAGVTKRAPTAPASFVEDPDEYIVFE